jgi:CheY-like chemotaxis protein
MSIKLKIAVADDELDTLEFLQEYLAHLGHEVRTAANGRRLVELCREFLPDVMVTDYAMPGLNGLAAAAEVNRERRVPLILISGRHDAEDAALTAAHIVRFLVKPIKTAELKEAVESVAAGMASKGAG